MIKLYKEKKDCCGCTACMSICPKGAISMQVDEEGFFYPTIDTEKCIECSLCKKVCSFQNGYNKNGNSDFPFIYAIKHKDEAVRKSSTSGGAFTAISDYILEREGDVYGVAFDESMCVVHQKANSKEEREKLKGSKYVQSDLKNTFAEIKALLQNDRNVLFTGTPCQTAGLKSYLDNKNTEKLILCDIVCHGTPSPLMWKEHIAFSEKKNNLKIIQYYCRSKVNGWHGHNELTIYENGNEDYSTALSQKHKKLFYSHNILRPSCHNCQYTNLRRLSDITIGDFWGIEKCMPDFDDNKGVSLLLLNSSKGKEIFANIKKNLEYRVSSTKDCLQPQLEYPTKPSPKRDKFWRHYNSRGYKYVIKKYAGYGFKNQATQYCVTVIRKTGLIKLIKRILKRGKYYVQK